MSIQTKFLAVALGVAAATAGTVAQAETIVVNLAGLQTFGEFGDLANPQFYFTIPSGSTVTGFTYSGLTFSTVGESWRSELVLSVNNFTGAPDTIDEFLDWAPSTLDSSGTFGPVTGSWGGASGVPGPTFGAGAAFTVGGGADNLYVTLYEDFDDNDVGPDAIISAGTLTINYTVAPIPEPATYGLMALGLLGVTVAARRRKS